MTNSFSLISNLFSVPPPLFKRETERERRKTSKQANQAKQNARGTDYSETNAHLQILAAIVFAIFNS